MLRGEEGNQSRELDELIGWLKQHPHPDVICLSNALLVGLVHKLKQELRSPVVCMLQGEDYFLDSLPQTQRELAWKTLAERATEVDSFIAPSRYFADLMGKRLNLPTDRVSVVFNGINLEGYDSSQWSEVGGQLQRSEEHTSELQSPCNLVCRLLLEKKKKYIS